MGSSWFQALKSEFEEPILQAFLLAEAASYTIYPPLSDVYSWSRLIPLDGVRVIILGQDPYHNAGQAHGLAFSVLPPTKPPGSLKNIYKQLSNDIDGFRVPSSGDLTSLAKLGVLFLNTCLTVRAHKAASHSKKGWEKFTERVICAVLNQNPPPEGIVFMAWGLPAQKTYSKIAINEEKHLILKSAHPSPLSAHRGFLGNGHFRLANEWLEERYGHGIDWNVLNTKGGP
ncbi:uracil-DNA glycosylase [Infundibulicybe gibba]|nr:uracil-DNA glycosylase [Infundibulicybe gibba]